MTNEAVGRRVGSGGHRCVVVRAARTSYVVLPSRAGAAALVDGLARAVSRAARVAAERWDCAIDIAPSSLHDVDASSDRSAIVVGGVRDYTCVIIKRAASTTNIGLTAGADRAAGPCERRVDDDGHQDFHVLLGSRARCAARVRACALCALVSFQTQVSRGLPAVWVPKRPFCFELAGTLFRRGKISRHSITLVGFWQWK